MNQETDMTTLLSTERSQLNVYPLEEVWLDLMEQCVQAVEPDLVEKPEIVVYGKVCKQNRSVCFYSDESGDFNYSTSNTPSKALPPCLRELMAYVNNTLHKDFNGVLVNKYVNGLDYIGKHSDDERKMDVSSGVAMLSYGAPRIFRIRDKSTKKILLNVKTDNCQMIHMDGQFQREFTHEIPIEKRVQEARVSFTFRRHVCSPL